MSDKSIECRVIEYLSELILDSGVMLHYEVHIRKDFQRIGNDGKLKECVALRGVSAIDILPHVLADAAEGDNSLAASLGLLKTPIHIDEAIVDGVPYIFI